MIVDNKHMITTVTWQYDIIIRICSQCYWYCDHINNIQLLAVLVQLLATSYNVTDKIASYSTEKL